MAYISGTGTYPGQQRTLVWVDRQGRETLIGAPPRGYTNPRISPDGGRLAVSALEGEQDLWLWDFARLTLTRLTLTPGADTYPAWSQDGRRVLFASEREGARNVFGQAANGAGTIERLTRSPNFQNPTAVSPDGRQLIFTELGPKTRDDVMQVEVNDTHKITPLVQSPFVERNGIVSPDGRWLAYEADDSGRLEIYVRPYPDVKTGHWQVSTNGGTRPLWSRTGRELFYVSPAGAILRVGVQPDTSWAATTPTTVVKEGYWTTPDGIVGRSYDLSPDGQRFLVFKPAAQAHVELFVVQHFDEMLKRLVPTN